MPDYEPSKWRMVDPNWRVPVDESEIFTPLERNKVPIGSLMFRMLMGFITFVMLGGAGVFAIAHLAGLEQIGWQDSCGISFILIMLRALDKATFGKQQ
jgi:hypothetical protein